MGLASFNRMRREAAEAEAAAQELQEKDSPIKLSGEEYAEMIRNKANVIKALTSYEQEFDDKGGAAELKEQLIAYLGSVGLIPDAN